MLDKEGNEVELSTKARNAIITDVVGHNFAPKAYRTLLLAYTDFSY